MTIAPPNPDPEESSGSDTQKEKRRKREKKGNSFKIRDANNVYVNSGTGNRAGDTNPPAKKGMSTLQVAASIAGIIGATAAVVALILANRPSDSPDKDSSQVSSTGSLVRSTGRTFEARITRTMDVDTNRFVGVKAYSDPTTRGKGTEVAHYPENGSVSVLCLNPSGREIKDRPWEDRLPETSVWYRLSTPDPQWIPSMYVTIDPGAGASVPQCS
ncbi:hypothetical protein ACFXA2_01595 [Micromonospora chalcea]